MREVIEQSIWGACLLSMPPRGIVQDACQQQGVILQGNSAEREPTETSGMAALCHARSCVEAKHELIG